MRRTLHNARDGLIRRAALLLLLGAAGLAAARAETVLVVSDPDHPVHRRTVGQLTITLRARAERELALRHASPTALVVPPETRLIVTVGTAAARAVLAQAPQVPALHALIPARSYERLVADARAGARTPRSAVFLDQPLARRFRLLGLALPGRTRAGVLLGPTSAELEPALRAAAGDRFALRVARVGEAPELLGALAEALDDADVLIAVADPLVFNRYSVQAILRTTYRRRVPVLGFSRSYVRAGALLAVYSTPEQIGRQVGDLLAAASAGDWTLPPPQWPRHFSVAVNERVAHSLGIPIGDEQALQQRLQAAETHTGDP